MRQSGVFAQTNAQPTKTYNVMIWVGSGRRSDRVNYTADCLTYHLCYNFLLYLRFTYLRMVS